MTNTITISFRAKLDDFAGGKGYKVPKLTTSHISIKDRDMLGTTIMGSINNADITKARIEKYAGMRVPGVVWENGGDAMGVSTNHEGWKISPRGNGFMADVSITLPLSR